MKVDALALVGPTASGKTAAALALADALQAQEEAASGRPWSGDERLARQESLLQLLQMILIASQFLATGTIFWQQDAAGTLTETAAETGGAATDPSVKLVVLIDRGSASASERTTEPSSRVSTRLLPPPSTNFGARPSAE